MLIPWIVFFAVVDVIISSKNFEWASTINNYICPRKGQDKPIAMVCFAMPWGVRLWVASCSEYFGKLYNGAQAIHSLY